MSMSGDSEDLITACRRLAHQLQVAYGPDRGVEIWTEVAKALPEPLQQEITLISLREPPIEAEQDKMDSLIQQMKRKIMRAEDEYGNNG